MPPRLLAPLLLAAAFAACKNPIVIQPPSEPLAGTAWELVAYRIADGPLDPVEPDSADLDGPYTVRFFAEGAAPDSGAVMQGLTGSTGCNVFRAGYRTNGRELHTSDFRITLQGCGHATEAIFAEGISEAVTWDIDDDTLRIVYDFGVSELFLARE